MSDKDIAKKDNPLIDTRNLDVQKSLKFILRKMYYVGVPMAVSFEDWLHHEDLYEN